MSRPINPWKVTGYKAGQNVVCKVMKAESGGYAVLIPKDNLPGFIQTAANHQPGEEVLAQFVCVHNNRILLSPLFSGTIGKGASLPVKSSKNWLEELENPDQQATSQGGFQGNYQEEAMGQTQSPFAPPSPDANEAYGSNSYGANGSNSYAESQMPSDAQQDMQAYQQYQMGTEYTQAPAEAYQNYQQESTDYAQGGHSAFAESQWQAPVEQTPTKRFRLRRAIDLVMPPIDQESLSVYQMKDYDLEWLITDLEGGMRTGCMKCTSEQQLSRSAVLLYKGKAVGCIYGCKSSPEARPTEESLTSMLNDLEATDAVVSVYDLPEDVTVAMSALFLGFPVERTEGLDAKSQFDFFMTYFTQNGSTACLAITLPSTKSTYLVFVHRGRFGGCFFVEEQIFTQDPNDIYKLFQVDPQARVEASLLQPETTAPGARFGYSLSMAKQKRN